MKVVCDNCRAVYKVPDEKLVKAVNKATCRQCNHKMLIPRPKPNADPNERTLVTAVPPTPPGAPPRGFDAGRQNDNTHPGRAASVDEVPVFPGTPAPVPRRPSSFGPPPSPGRGYDNPSTLVSDRPPGMPATNQETAIRQSPMHTPSAALVRRTPGPVARHDPRYTPAPMGYIDDIRHDPSGDLNWALLGTATALAGAFFLSVLSIYNHPLIMWFGLAMSFGGTVLTFMVLLTGGRGRRPAKVILSVLSGFLVAMVMASSFVGTKWGAEKVINAFDIKFADLTEVDGQKPELSPVTVTPPQPVITEPIIEKPAPEPVADQPPEKPEPAKPAPVREEPVAKPPPAPVKPPPPKPKKDPIPVKVPMQVINVMLRNNVGVKSCFVPLAKAGQLPPRADVRLTIQPTGRPTGISVVQPNLRPALQGCMTQAITRISFPKAQQPTTVTFPFILQ